MFRTILMATAMLAAAPAAAQDNTWFEAESNNFRVYSSGTQQDAEKMVKDLERLDRALRLFRNMPLDAGEAPDTSKVTVYQFGKQRDIGKLAGSQGVAGFFIPRAGDPVAFVPLESERARRSSGSPGTRDATEFYDYSLSPLHVLFHEYTHYFMFQHAPAAYPAWYIEGLAELFGTLNLVDGGFNLGDVPESRRGYIQRVDVKLDRLLNPPRRRTYMDVIGDYAHGWLMTSYLTFAPAREGQLATYLRLLNEGKPSLEAARTAFGDLKKLEKEVNEYRTQRSMGRSVRMPAQAEPRVAVRQLSADESAMMPLHVRSTAGVTPQEAKSLVGDARRLAAQFPRSVPVLLAATEAEFDAGNLAEAEALANRVVAIDAKAIDAHLYLANIAMRRAKSNASYLPVARKHFLAANAINHDHPLALRGYWSTFVLAAETPPANAVAALEQSYRLASFDGTTRLYLAYQLALQKRDREVLAVLGPLINSPHATKETQSYRELVDKFEAGDRQPLIDKLRPKLKDEDEKA